MSAFDYDLVCIGSGPAGQRGAVQAAKMGRRVALVEKRDTLGGVCLDTGTIPSKTFREAVVWAVGAARMAGPTTVQSRPGIDTLLARIDEVVSRESGVIANQLGRNGVQVFCGEASFVDPHRLRVTAADGAIGGAAAGAEDATDFKRRYGISDEFVDQVGKLINPGDSAVFVLARTADPDLVAEKFRGYGGTILRTNLSLKQAARAQRTLEG